MAFNGRFVLNMIHFGVRKGVSLKALLELSGKSEEELTQEDCTLESETYNQIIEYSIQKSGDQYLGLHAGENLNLAAAGIILQLVQTSKTIKQALELCCEYANLGCSSLPMSLTKNKEYYEVSLTPDPVWFLQSELVVRHTTEGVLAFTIREFHSLTRMKQYPVEIHFTWDKDRDAAELERVFGCPVYFNRDKIAVILKKEDVEREVLTSDYGLLQVLITHASQKSQALKEGKNFSNIVRESVVNLIKPHFPTIQEVASHLNMTPRTLQRRLKEEGLVFKEMIEELRKEFAMGYLRKDLSIGEVAYLLSYADISAFTRAFKKWTGKSPSEFRKEMLV